MTDLTQPGSARSLLVVQSEHLNFDSQVAGFRQHRDMLAERGISVSVVPMVGEFEEEVLEREYDTIALNYRISDNHSPIRIKQIIDSLRELFPGVRLLLLDDHGSPYPRSMALVDHVDHYFCRGIAPSQRYSTAGKTVYREMDVLLAKALFGAKVPPVEMDGHPVALDSSKVDISWNIGLDKRFGAGGMFDPDALQPRQFRDRKHIMHCRLGVPANLPRVLLRHRELAIETCLSLPAKPSIATRSAVAPQEFQLEMLDAKCVLSPWGWAEICFRDFEAISCGCLLFKPDMSHFKTEPDLFVAGETYVPVAHDFSDLSEKVATYLERPELSQRIINTARERFQQYLTAEWFCDRVEGILDKRPG